MNKLAALATLAIAFVSACTCGGYTGGGDQVLARGQDMLILCDNGGFYARVNNPVGVIEGRFTTYANGTVMGYDGSNVLPPFTLTWNDRAGASTVTELPYGSTAPNVGNGDWTLNDMNQVELDHANILCTDLESRSWWTAQ